MPDDVVDTEELLHVGRQAILSLGAELSGDAGFKTMIQGWQRNQFVMLDRPRVHGRFVELQSGEECIIRFLEGGKACGFNTRILNWESRRERPCVHVAWPERLEFVSFRKYERIRLESPCTVFGPDDAQTEGTLLDISRLGCGICVPERQPVDTPLAVDFPLPGNWHIEKARVEVKNTTVLEEGFLLGCQFEPGQLAVDNDISFFITTTLEQDRLAAAAPSRLLFITDAQEKAAAARRHFGDKGYEIITASDLVDAFYRLRMASPSALFISHSKSDVDSANICQVIKNTPGFHHLPIYIYGAETASSEEEENLLATGAEGYCNSLDKVESVIDSLGHEGKLRTE